MLKTKIREFIQPIVQSEIDRVIDQQRWSPANQVAQRNLIATWRQCDKAGIRLGFRDVGFRVYSQFEEDGILLYIFTVVGTVNRLFVDLGSADGINSNCANLALNHGWTGLFIDGDQQNIERGRDRYSRHPSTSAYSPTFKHAMIDRENVNNLITAAGFEGELDLLSIDIDGNDYWVWEAIDCISPRVVIIETHIEFGTRPIVVPYDQNYVYPGKHPDYHGASPVAMAKLASSKGYRLIGAIDYGFNTIYMRHDVGQDAFPEVAAESVLTHPRNADRAVRFKAIKDWEYLTV